MGEGHETAKEAQSERESERARESKREKDKGPGREIDRWKENE